MWRTPQYADADSLASLPPQPTGFIVLFLLLRINSFLSFSSACFRNQGSGSTPVFGHIFYISFYKLELVIGKSISSSIANPRRRDRPLHGDNTLLPKQEEERFSSCPATAQTMKDSHNSASKKPLH